MKTAVNIDPVGKILRKRGLETNGRVQKIMTVTCARYMDPYVPMSQGMLKNTRIINSDSVDYVTPYAKFQYYGKVMVGEKSRSPWAKLGERKIVTSKDLVYHGAPMRGAFWDKRMWTDKKAVIIKTVAKAAGGKAK